ncbi:MAG TPA: GNAT family N-acetyltransferase [Gammaproteobacteria bacterium]|nr:GNAT family N-acetyltransferase [Gammaproteobacteria bacterium]
MNYHKPYAELLFGEYLFTADKKKLDLEYLYNLLCIPSRYSTGLPPERFPLIIENSVCFSVLHNGKQVGFARVITDFSEFASLWDVYIDDEHRSKGVGKALMKYLLEHPRLRGVFRWFLMTEDAHGLYQKYGFKSEAYNPYVMMRVSSAL